MGTGAQTGPREDIGMSSRPGHVRELVHENGEYIQSIWRIMLVGALVAGADEYSRSG